MQKETKKLYRSRKEKVLAGVCGGLADYFRIDPVLMRTIFLFLVFLKGTGVFFYLAARLLVPLEPGQKELPFKEKAQSLADDLAKKR